MLEVWIFYGDIALHTVLQVQEISQQSIRPKWPSRLDRLDNGSNSTIQQTHISASNMKTGLGPAILELIIFFETKIDPDYTPNFSPILKKIKRQSLDRI